ncbi:MAG: hypothetical protein RJQ09_00160 [Cyclobacteriaceae bacterium]
MNFRKTLIPLLLIVILANDALAQDQAYDPYTGQVTDVYRSPFRAFLNQFSINFSTGYARTKYTHELTGFYFVQTSDQQLLVNNNVGDLPEEFSGVTNWFNQVAIADTVINRNIFDVPFVPIDQPVNNPLLAGRTFIMDTDTAALKFISRGRSIPVNLFVHYNFQEKYRFGAGIMWERQKFNPFEPQVFGDSIRNFNPGFKKTSYLRYYVLLGYKFFDFWQYSLAAELNVGKARYGNNFVGITSGLYTSFGLSIEKNLSEYMKVVLKPTYDIKNFSLTLDEQGTAVDHFNGTWFLHFGISIRIPEIPRSPIAGDNVQVKHVITHPETGVRMEVRGQPIWRWNDPKVGQNHRKLHRYKRGNKKKINPY